MPVPSFVGGPTGSPGPGAPGIDAGPLGLEARHTWYGDAPGSPTAALNVLWDNAGNRVVLGEGAARPGRVTASSLLKLTKVSGLHSRPDADDERASLSGRIGEIVYPSIQRGKTVTYEGVIAGRTLADLRRAEHALRASFAGTGAGTMLVQPHPDYGSVPYAYAARCTQLELGDELQATNTATLGPHQRPFVIALRQHDPRYYVWTALARSPASGTHPCGSSTFVVTNDGNAPAEPIFTVWPPSGLGITALELHNDTLGTVLAFDAPTTGWATLAFPTQHLVIDFRDRSARTGEGGSILRSLTFGSSTWWDDGQWGLAPGPNTLRVQFPTGGTWVVEWLHASW